jgi:hypothetical protein
MGTGSTSHKYAVDASHTSGGGLNVQLTDPENGSTFSFNGKSVYVSERGQQLLNEWHRQNSMPSGWAMIVKEDSWTDTWIHGYNEQA